MQELIEIFDGYEISGAIGSNKTFYMVRYRIQLDRKGKVVSTWKGFNSKEVNNTINTSNPAFRGYYTPYITFGTYSKDFTNNTITPSLRWYDAKGEVLKLLPERASIIEELCGKQIWNWEQYKNEQILNLQIERYLEFREKYPNEKPDSDRSFDDVLQWKSQTRYRYKGDTSEKNKWRMKILNSVSSY